MTTENTTSTIKIVTYEARVNQMKCVEDVADQLRKAKTYAMGLRKRAKAASTLADKVELGRAVKDAEGVLRQLRHSVFDLEDRFANAETEGRA